MRKKERYFNAALKYHAAKKEDKAYYYINKVLLIDTTNTEAYSYYGEWCFNNHQFTKARNIFLKASQICWDGEARFAKPLAKSYLFTGQYYAALELVQKYGGKNLEGDWKNLYIQASFMQTAFINQVPAVPVDLGQKINSLYPELFPSITLDTSILYFTRRINMDEQLFKATLEDTCVEWKSVENLVTLNNYRGEQSTQYISTDGHYLFFTWCGNRSLNGWEAGGCDLYMAYRKRIDTEWSVPQPFGATINTPFYEGMPTLSPDNRDLFFVSDRPGGYGGLDIWISRFEDGLWQLPVNAGPDINTSGNEMAPFLDADNKTFYFTSDGLPGLGGKDLYIAKRKNDTGWSKPKNLGYPINTPFDEMSACVTMDGKTLYFASDRNGPPGNYDLFQIALPPYLQPEPICFLNGIVYDSLTKDPLNYAQIYIINITTKDTLYKFQSNRGDGSFMITLPIGETYARHTVRFEYMETNDTFTLDKKLLLETTISKRQLYKNIVMLPSDYKEPIKPIPDSLIATIHFDLNRIALTELEKSTIKNAIADWTNINDINYIVNAYTDNTGTPIINEELSVKRAKLVADELKRLGVGDSHIDAHGWGESKMLVSNDTEEGRKINRRVEIIVKR